MQKATFDRSAVRGRAPELWAEALWQRTYINALEHAHQLPPNQKHFVSFDRLLHTPIEKPKKRVTFKWKTRKDTKKTIQQKLDYSLPTEKPRKENSSALHHTTKAIETFLNASQTINKKTLHPLIADQINQSVSTGREFLQLNRVSQSGQTVLPNQQSPSLLQSRKVGMEEEELDQRITSWR